jgi:hypothetical protein
MLAESDSPSRVRIAIASAAAVIAIIAAAASPLWHDRTTPAQPSVGISGPLPPMGGVFVGPTGQAPGTGGGLNTGAEWQALQDPIFGYPASSLSGLLSIHHPIYLPQVQLAWSDSVVALGGARTTAALAYSSGIEVTFTSYDYSPPDAPSFSQGELARAYRQLAAEAGGGMFQDSVLGIPVRVILTNIDGERNPGSVSFALGTTNDKVEMVEVIWVIGRYSTADLESVASSIIAQWEQVHPATGN